VYDEASGFSSTLISKYLREVSAKDASVNEWNVVVVTTANGKPSEIPFGLLGSVRCNNRSAMKGGGDIAWIKALMSKRDLLLDANPMPSIPKGADWNLIKGLRTNDRPLLLLYPIDRSSIPQRAGDREPLDAVHEVLGVGILVPGDPERSHDYVTANLSPIEPEDESLDEMATELLEG
jgi:hypothetical protein